MRSPRILLVVAILAGGTCPLSAQTDFGWRDPSAGDVDATAFPEGFGSCSGKHLVKTNFVPIPGPPDYRPLDWVEAPVLVEFDAGAPVGVVDLSLHLDALPPGIHRGVLTLGCVACSSGGDCEGLTKQEELIVRIPHANEFGAHPADTEFDGLVNGKPVPIEQLLPAVLEDISQSSFGQLPNAQSIITTLEEKYLEHSLSDVTLVRHEDSIDEDGKIRERTIAVDEQSQGPGEASYVLNIGSGLLAEALADEEIYIGVDLSTAGITKARENPGEYYIFTVDGKLGVLEKADMVHNLIHEGLHATQGGAYNVSGTAGRSRAPIEEELDGFRAGNAAAAAMGLPGSRTRPGAGYGAGSNPKYVPLFPAAGLGAGGQGPGTPGGQPPAGRTGTEKQPSGDDEETDAGRTVESRREAKGDGEPAADDEETGADTGTADPEDETAFRGCGYSEALAGECVEDPVYVYSCDEEDESCLKSIASDPPCTLGEEGYTCGQYPSAVLECGEEERCRLSMTPVSGACEWGGDGYDCSPPYVPSYEYECEIGGCELAGTPVREFASGVINSPLLLSGSRLQGMQIFVMAVPPHRLRTASHGETGAAARSERWAVSSRASTYRPPSSASAVSVSGPRVSAEGFDLGSALPNRAAGLGSLAKAPDPEPRLYIRGLGASTGEAFQVEMANLGEAPVTLAAGAVVVEPVAVDEEAREALAEEKEGLGPSALSARMLDGYCLEFTQEVPPSGTLFRLASRELQEEFAPVRRILEAGEKVRDLGLLNPDSDPTDYFHSVRQWAIWTDLEGFDREAFTEAFLEHTRENLEAAGQEWTDEIEAAIKSLIPNRWEDVTRLLEKAERVGASAGP